MNFNQVNKNAGDVINPPVPPQGGCSILNHVIIVVGETEMVRTRHKFGPFSDRKEAERCVTALASTGKYSQVGLEDYVDGTH